MSKNPEFLNFFNNLNIRIINELIEKDLGICENKIFHSLEHLKIIERIWTIFLPFYDKLKNIREPLDHIEQIHEIRVNYGDYKKSALEKKYENGDLEGEVDDESYEKLLEFIELEEDEIEKYLTE